MKKEKFERICSKSHFAGVLACLLMKENISQQELAEKTGITPATISHYINGRNTPSHRNLTKIANCLGCTPEVFFGDINAVAKYVDLYPNTFAYNLLKLLTENGVSQEELANAIGVSRQSVNFYVNNKQTPTKMILESIADFFNMSTDELIGKNTKEEPQNIRILVDRMPTSQSECMFAKWTLSSTKDEFIGDYKCMFGKRCVLENGTCPYLKGESNEGH